VNKLKKIYSSMLTVEEESSREEDQPDIRSKIIQYQLMFASTSSALGVRKLMRWPSSGNFHPRALPLTEAIGLFNEITSCIYAPMIQLSSQNFSLSISQRHFTGHGRKFKRHLDGPLKTNHHNHLETDAVLIILIAFSFPH
jgi:hypothetical protein